MSGDTGQSEGLERMLSVREVAGILGVKPETVRRMVRNGLIRAGRPGTPPRSGVDRRPLRFAPADVRVYVERICVLGDLGAETSK